MAHSGRRAAWLLLVALLEAPRLARSVGQPPQQRDARAQHPSLQPSSISIVELQKNSFGSGFEKPQSYEVTKLRELRHIDAPWTQGLEFTNDGQLVETSGNYPAGIGSAVRIIDPNTGAVTKQIHDGLQAPRFIEGITQKGGRWFASTYEDKVVMQYDEDFKLVGEHRYPWTGWGLARSSDGSAFLATNGTEYVMRLDPENFDAADVKVATCLGKRVPGLNELEMVNDFLGQGPTLLGNVINTRIVLALDPETARCTGVFSLDHDLEPVQPDEAMGYHVANGIAYDPQKGSFYVTGKNWVSMFEVRVGRPEDEPGRQRAAHALSVLTRHLAAEDGP